MTATLAWRTLGWCAAWATAGATGSTWPALDEAVAHARAHAPQVVVAQGQLGVARSAAVGAARWPVGNPYIQVFADRSALQPGRFLEPAPATNVQPEVYLPLLVPGQRGARMEEAHHLAHWKHQETQGAAARAVGDVVTAYGDAVLAWMRAHEAQEAESLAQEEAAMMEERWTLRDATRLDAQVQRAEVTRYAQVRTEAQVRFLEARSRLAVLTGLHGLDAPPQDLATWPALRRAWTVRALMLAAEQGPLMQAYQAEEEYWRAAHTRAQADRFSPITLIMWGTRGDRGDIRVGGGVGFTLPVFDRNQGEVARVLAERSRVVTTRDSVLQAIQARAQACLEELQLIHSWVAALDLEGLPAAARVVQATQESYLAGKVERHRVVNARRELALARERRLQLLEAGWRAYGELASFLGEMP